MPVSRYPSIEALPGLSPAAKGDLGARIRKLWNRSLRFASPGVVRGVVRFASIADANEARQRATAERMRRLQLRRKRGQP
jgi:hypothetical protein